MSQAAQAFVNPEVVRWARERARLPLEKLARKLQKKSEDVGAWERGASALR